MSNSDDGRSPQLILSCDPGSADLALDELRAAAADAVALQFAPGVFLVRTLQSFWEIAERWRGEPPIFVRHICPVHTVVPLAGAAADLDALATAATGELAPLIEPGAPFSVQTRILADLPHKPYDVNQRLSEAIQAATGAPLDVRAPLQVLSVVCAEEGGAPAQAYLGISLVVHNLSNWAGGMRRFAREPAQVSRSEFKLLEALEVFGVELPPRGVALDLGAAPGGWTRVLRQRDQYVTAVDPGDLDPRVAADRGVRHKRMTANAYLADEPDRFDLIVDDMRMDARDSARVMVACAPLLYAHGCALMTLKLPEQNRARIIDHALTILRATYEVLGARQLFHNRSEITLYLRPLSPHR